MKHFYCLSFSIYWSKPIFLIIAFLHFFAESNAQIILYSENFNSYINGTTVGSGTPAKWTRDISGASPNTFSVQNQLFEARNVMGVGIWYSQSIDISNNSNVQISINLSESGNLTASTDYIRLYYKLNGGSETLFATNGNMNGDFTSATALQTGLNGNTLQIVIRISNNSGSEYHRFDNVLVRGDLKLTYTVTNVNCNGGSNGAIDLLVAGGTLPYTYSWSNGAATQDVSGLAAGTYSVTAMDAASTTGTASITITQPAALSASISGTNVSCNGGSNGSANLTAFGGTTPYSYLWSNGAATEDVSNLSAGTFTATVTDAKSCSVSSSVTIIQPAALSSSISGTSISCYGGSNGAADLTVTGGTSPYFYSWSNTATTQDIFNLTTGAYKVTVTDNNGCSKIDSITIIQPAAISISISATNALCSGSSDGSADLTVSGGVSPYSYSWSNGVSTQNISLVSAGTYNVTVTDLNNCTQSASVTITQPSALSTSIAGTNVTCNGSGNGIADLTVSGGTAPYAYSWSTGATTQDLSNLAPATYQVTVTDNNACVRTDFVTISEPSILTASTTGTNVSCFGGSNGTVDLTVTGGTTAYSYLWSNNATTQDLSDLPIGNYHVTVTDANGCTATTNITLIQPAALTTAITSPALGGGFNVSCNDGNDGSLDLIVNGGVTTYSYLWSNGATTQNLSNIVAGLYKVTVTDANSCTKVDSITLTQPPAITAPIASPAFSGGFHISCNGLADGSLDLNPGGGVPPYTFAWSNGPTTEDQT
ncbi:MAG TPA: SprB repeat-containing protein, partial [Chitinophagales bacterium]|nr:SprB repeat-containing protein [Chitinophagales bacterium]